MQLFNEGHHFCFVLFCTVGWCFVLSLSKLCFYSLAITHNKEKKAREELLLYWIEVCTRNRTTTYARTVGFLLCTVVHCALVAARCCYIGSINSTLVAYFFGAFQEKVQVYLFLSAPLRLFLLTALNSAPPVVHKTQTHKQKQTPSGFGCAAVLVFFLFFFVGTGKAGRTD